MLQPLTLKFINRKLLNEFPLPKIDADADKDARGCAFIVGGYNELPGAVVLAAEAAVSAGAGKLKIGTTESIQVPVGMKVPEAMVVALDSKREVLTSNAANQILKSSSRSSALLIGPGLKEGPDLEKMAREISRKLKDQTLILDAGALSALRKHPGLLKSLKKTPIITPHAGEMAQLLGIDRDVVESNADAFALEYAQREQVIVVLKGSESFIAAPDGRLFVHSGKNPGLATSGSGDVLAGVIAGLVSRGADSLTAAIWGVHLHASAGDELAKSRGKVGFLAREISREIPRLTD
ncbi:MAG: NAD(P)H-hydrate dehydratase [Proteobacteria bacterium]|nr:MAG: NAD(P)H-hydrate dehydratase [Pseudomonadota bacterium]